MRTVIKTISVLAVPIFLLSSGGCKKGEGDPLISLHTRKARVAGEWTVSSWLSESNYTSSNAYGPGTSSSSGSYKMEIDGGTVITSNSGSSTNVDNTNPLYNSSSTNTSRRTGAITATIV